MMKYRKELNFYRNNKTGNGCAAGFKLSEIKDGNDVVEYAVFLTMAQQIPNSNNFDWKGKSITVKLSDADISYLIAVIKYGNVFYGSDKGLFHESPKGGFKIVDFREKEDKSGFVLKVSGKDPAGNSLGNYTIALSIPDSELMLALFTKSLSVMYGW